MMIDVVGIDPSLTSTGIATDELEAIHTDMKGPARLVRIRDRILDIVCAEDVGVVIEGYSFAQRNTRAHAAGELGGVIRVALYESGIPYVDVPPPNRAKFATGKGNASKSEVVSAVSARTGLVFAGKGSDDLCDAWVLQEMGLAALGRPRYDWPKQNLTALEKIDWTRLIEKDK